MASANADIDVTHVCKLSRAARKPTHARHHARAVELYERALVAAEALRQTDCLIVATLRHMHVDEQAKMALAGISKEDRAAMAAALAAVDSLSKARLPAVLETLERRRASDTLLPGRCRAHEVAWYADMLRCDRSYLPEDAPQRPADERAATLHLAQTAPRVGVAVYFDVAHTVYLTLLGRSTSRAPPDLFLASCLTYTEHALRLVLQRASEHTFLTLHESVFVDAFRTDLLPILMPQAPECARVLAAWRDLEHSGALNKLHGQELCESFRRAEQQRAAALAAKDAAVPLRTCALPSCCAREAHVAHFKKCSACGAVVYCSKEHQAEHWPAHKAACKAACKAASQAAAVGEGGASQAA